MSAFRHTLAVVALVSMVACDDGQGTMFTSALGHTRYPFTMTR